MTVEIGVAIEESISETINLYFKEEVDAIFSGGGVLSILDDEFKAVAAPATVNDSCISLYTSLEGGKAYTISGIVAIS